MNAVFNSSPSNPLAARARRAAAEWILKDGPVDLFVTLTFARDVSDCAAHKAFHQYLIKVAQRAGQHLHAAWAWGRQQGGRLHFHALLRGLDSPLVRENFPKGIWPGDVQLKAPQSQADVAAYLTRQEHDEWNVGTVCTRARPCRRKRSCVVALAPWPSAKEDDAN
ncbi:MAG: hypothetical protein PHU25_09830 [Deltaproteobacteria bacterium]|nr:hypothetical protein [Deltaproteobacteria bacterium]